ncbi:hypothetical protein NG99_27025 [Erwinia typographi]|uniref:Uncharacterized protein n=1 Tax=Erwinia typographi TaxID=371042 RepID=A0A0A3YKQ2_9GAMM|nr:hypothetical protein NG99_27025 [Erwinia typographi]
MKGYSEEIKHISFFFEKKRYQEMVLALIPVVMAFIPFPFRPLMKMLFLSFHPTAERDIIF